MKYTIDGSTLTGIADAIRTQYGEDSPIAVTDMAEAILGIEGGGGGEEQLPFVMTSGEVQLTSNVTTSYTIEHNGNAIPIIVGWWSDGAMRVDTSVIPSFTSAGALAMMKESGYAHQVCIMRNYQGDWSVASRNFIGNVTDSSFDMIAYGESYPIRARTPIKWFAIFSTESEE